METNLEQIYNDLIEKDVNILDLYIYSVIINEDVINNAIEPDLTKIVATIRDNYINDGQSRDLEYHINNILYGFEDDTEWD